MPLLPFVVAWLMLAPVLSFSQSAAIPVIASPSVDADLIAPGRGGEQWHDRVGAISYPSEGNAQQALDAYYRFTWNRLEGPVLGSYDWSYFDGIVQGVVNRGQKLSFGIMSCYPDSDGKPGMSYYDNGNSAYPEYLHRLMQTEPVKDWKTNGDGPVTGAGSWVPNWNSVHYLERLRALHEALHAHILGTSYTATAGPHAGKTIAFKDVIFSIDLRGYGAWGEWHSAGIIRHMSSYPNGAFATAASLKTIIDHHVRIFRSFRVSLMISALDAERLTNTYTPKEVTAYILNQSTDAGPLGWRRDNWGATDGYIDGYLLYNNESYGSSGPFKDIILERWKQAPVTGEPPGWMPSRTGICAYDDLERQVRIYHASMVGNGNYGSNSLPDCAKENIRAAFKAGGYRLTLSGGQVSSPLHAGGPLTISLNWINQGIAPTYEDWDVVFELRDSAGSLAWWGASAFRPKLFLPADAATPTQDVISIPDQLKAGTYRLNLLVRDPSGYRQPLPLALAGRHADGSYTLGSLSIAAKPAGEPEPEPVPDPGVPGGPGNPAPTPYSCSFTHASVRVTESCDNQPFYLVLDTANGTAPYFISINGTDYTGLSIGDTIASHAAAAVEKVWSNNPRPRSYEDNGVELGMKFFSKKRGTIRGLRFFSSADPAGTYTGHLWSQSGELLATVEFTGITSYGWQEARFSNPVPVDSGNIYIASYYTSGGRYAATSLGLADSMDNGASLVVPGTSATSGNGVYTYGAPGFPTSTFNATNYWVDVLFTADRHLFRVDSMRDSSGCTLTQGLDTLEVIPQDCVQSRPVNDSVTQNPGTVVSKGYAPMASQPVIEKEGYRLGQNYPNPFSGETIIPFSIPEDMRVTLSLFDLGGRLVKVILNGPRQAGTHTIRLEKGGLTRGFYFYRLQAGSWSETKKMMIE